MNSPRKSVVPRRIRFDYPPGSMDRHFVQGELMFSHFTAYLSAVLPPGEEFLVRSVRRVVDRIEDPDLVRRARGFIGQELTHGREHEVLNQRLREMGYPVQLIEFVTARGLAIGEKIFSPLTCMAITAAVEHFTAMMAETMLSDQRALDMVSGSEVRPLLLWHCYEESEHRSVAFDVYQAIGGSERRRTMTMRLLCVVLLALTLVSVTGSLLCDRAAYHPIRLLRSFATQRDNVIIQGNADRLRAYLRPGFHPDDVDNTELLERWGAELFGERGELADHMRHGSG